MVEEVQDAHDDLIVGFRLYPPLPLHPEVRLHLRRRYRADIGIFRLLDIVNQKFHGRFEIMEAEIKRQCMMLEDASKHLLKNKKTTTGVILLCLLKCCFWYGIPYLLFRGVQFQGNPALSLSQVFAITSLSVMLAAVIPSPAGIGSTEFVFTTLFAGIVGTGMAGSASLLYRFGTFVFPFLVGTVVVLIRHFRRKKISGNRI